MPSCSPAMFCSCVLKLGVPPNPLHSSVSSTGPGAGGAAAPCLQYPRPNLPTQPPGLHKA